jgi:hypothetical protein
MIMIFLSNRDLFLHTEHTQFTRTYCTYSIAGNTEKGICNNVFVCMHKYAFT